MKRSAARIWQSLGIALMVVLMAASPAVVADERQREAGPGAAAMTLDALVARPLLVVATLGGSAVFLASLPFTALGGGVDEAANTLIKTPAEATFRRCLGCTTSRRSDER